MQLRRTVYALLIVLFCDSSIAQVANQKLQIHHIDVGQGDGAVLISPQRQVVLFDAGKDMANRKNCDGEIAYLDQLGVQQVDYVFISHYHSDHIGCIPAVLKKFPVKTAVYDRGFDYPGATYTNYVTAVGNKRKTATLGQTVTLDEGSANKVLLKVVSLNGTYRGGKVDTQNENDLSVSVLVSFGAFREEIGGDLSGDATDNYKDIETGVAPSVGVIDVYKVHHHCSSHSTNEAWLKATQPTVAIISTGDGNRYSHPAEDCLERLHEADISKAYWTEEGAGGKPDRETDVIGGDISIEVPATGTIYTVSYNNGAATDTYQIKGTNGGGSGAAPTASPGAAPRYAYSIKGHLYYDIDCPAVKRISSGNLKTSVDPPPDKEPSSCVKEIAH